jgi:hypothetical protein
MRKIKKRKQSRKQKQNHNMPSMINILQNLLLLTENKKSHLARILGVEPQCVYDWFRNQHIPKYAFRLMSESIILQLSLDRFFPKSEKWTTVLNSKTYQKAREKQLEYEKTLQTNAERARAELNKDV